MRAINVILTCLTCDIDRHVAFGEAIWSCGSVVRAAAFRNCSKWRRLVTLLLSSVI